MCLQLTKALTILLIFSLYFSAYSRAEEVELSLQLAIEKANTADHRISEREKLVDAARGLLEEAKGAESWIFDVNSFVGLSPDVKGGIFEDAEGNITIEDDALDFDGVSPWYNLQFQIVYPFSTLGKAEAYAEAALNNIKVQMGEVSLQRSKTYLDVSRAYYGYLAARDAVYMLEDADKRIDSAIDLVQGWLDKGDSDIKQSDLFALQTGSGLINRFLSEAKGLQEIADAGLKFLTGIETDSKIVLEDRRLEPVPLPEGTLEHFKQLALKNRPEMEQVEAGLSARRALLQASHAEKYPNLYAGVAGSIAYSPNRPKLDNIAIFDPFNHAGATPIVGIKWDWWSGRQSAKVTQAKGEYEALVEKKSFAQKGIPFQVAEQYHQVHSYHAMVGSLYEGVRAGRRWLLASLVDFEAGLEQARNVMEAFQGYLVIYGDYLQVLNEYNLHVARLRVVTGEIK